MQTIDVTTVPDGYHNGSTKKTPISKIPLDERPVIAWDMEGMNLSGDNKPQHSVLFGCSREVDNPMVDKDLQSIAMLDYIIEIGKANPTALHVGYGFKYDANMLVKHLGYRIIVSLWKDGTVRFRDSRGFNWTLWIIPGKKMTITKYAGNRPRGQRKAPGKVTVTIYDYSSFFGGAKFLTTCEQILREDLTDSDRQVIEHGKSARGYNEWRNIDTVQHYWSREIVLMQRVFEKFRDVMFKAGFALKEWYGPGALANYINSVNNIRPRIAAAQVTSGAMPLAVHEASKVAFTGGRFELFKAGRHEGPVYAVDINSAYPHALTMIPSLDPNVGRWRHVQAPSSIKRFGFYRVSFKASNGQFFDARPMPLPFRDNRGMISYPNMVHGWYASPEARMVFGMPGAVVHEGWFWDSAEADFPWEFLHDMYNTRMRLGKDNLMSMPFKLGPNSLYGKYAQTVGWDEENRLPPKSHALPIAAWVTSYCRSMLWNVIRQIPGKVIGVETDSVYTTVDPRTLDIKLGDGLGEWDFDVYDEMLYMQSGMYHSKKDGEWSGTRSRGIARTEYTYETAANYLQRLVPGQEWNPLRVTTAPRFVGAGAALAMNNGLKHHCRWIPQTKEITFGETGKRRHVQGICKACRNGSSPYDEPHTLVINTQSDGHTLSYPRKLPWEAEHPKEIQDMKLQLAYEAELIGVK